MEIKSLNVELVEAFGDLEKLCNDIYGENHGVTLYIEELSKISYHHNEWEDILDQLKRVRHKRNQLSHHDVSFSEPLTEEEDITFLKEFRNALLAQTDPLSQAQKEEAVPPHDTPPLGSKFFSAIASVFDRVNEFLSKFFNNI